MKTLCISMLFPQSEQAFPFFLEYVHGMSPSFSKVLVLDFRAEQKLIPQNIPQNFEFAKTELEKDFPSQLCRIRNAALKKAAEGGFDALIFLQPDIFPPNDMLLRLTETKKEIISPAFFFREQNTVFSNAFQISGEKENHQIKPLLFYDLLPGGIRKVDSVSLSALFLSKNVFEKLEFLPAKDSIEEIVFLAESAKKLSKEVFVDSSNVCGKLSQLQLFSHYYFAAQKEWQH